MKATFTTKCGCERVISVLYPPQPYILLALRTDRMSVWFDEDQEPRIPPRLDMRKFVLHRTTGGPYGEAFYLEA